MSTGSKGCGRDGVRVRLQAPGGIAALYEELGLPSAAGSSNGGAPAGSAAGASSLAAGVAAAGSGGADGSAEVGGGGAPPPAAGAGKGKANNAAALAFLAMCVKDHGAVDATIELLEKARAGLCCCQGQSSAAVASSMRVGLRQRHAGCGGCTINRPQAVSLDPLHAGYALNLAHAWELHQRLDRVVRVAAEGLGRAGHPALGGGTDLQVRARELGVLSEV